MRNFRELKIWERSHNFCLEIYRATNRFPKEEIFGLTSQMRRSAASIPTNIAEGCGRDSNADFLRFLRISMGSASELEYQLLLCRDLNFLEKPVHEKLSHELVEIRRMLNAYMQKLKSEDHQQLLPTGEREKLTANR